MHRLTNVCKTLNTKCLRSHRLPACSFGRASRRGSQRCMLSFDIACLLLTQRGACTGPPHADRTTMHFDHWMCCADSLNIWPPIKNSAEAARPGRRLTRQLGECETHTVALQSRCRSAKPVSQRSRVLRLSTIMCPQCEMRILLADVTATEGGS